MRAFIEVAGRRTEPVKWQVTGPVTLGLGLLHAGLPATKAFAISEVAVTARVKALDAALSAAFPEAGQLMVLDEPGLTGMAHPGFPLDPRQVVDLLGSALGATTATAGIHCCGSTDWGVIDQAGPAVLSMPADHGAIRSGGALRRLPGAWRAHRVGSDPDRRPSSRQHRPLLARARRGVVRARPRRMRPGALAHAGHRHA